MNKIQQLVEELKSVKSMLQSDAEEMMQEYGDETETDKLLSKAAGINFCIEKLTLLLKTDTEASNQ